MKNFKFIILVIMILSFFSCDNIYYGKKEPESDINGKKENTDTAVTNSAETEIPENKKITVIGVGDIMLGSNYPSKNLLPKNDYNILSDTEKILQDADITIGNLEGTLFDEGGTPKSCSDPSVCFVFRTPSKYGQYLKEAGFDYLSIANNHSNDFGDEGIRQTMKNLDELGIKYTGIKKLAETTIIEKDNLKYGFVSFAPLSKTVDLNDYEYGAELIKSLKSEVDIVIVMFHGGAEGNGKEHLTRKTEMFFGENRGNVFKFARMAVDAGADIIFGQGPHVTRAIELYKNKFISYSAGNFATYGKFNLKGSSGIAPIFKITLDSKGNFIEGEIIPVRQTKGVYGPFIDENKSAVKEIISLNKSDFPEGNGLSVSEDGKIQKK
mgnify:FL=1